jgi:hypothetical protein
MAKQCWLCGAVALVMLGSTQSAIGGPFGFETVAVGDYASLTLSDGSVGLTVTAESPLGGVWVREPLPAVAGLLGSRTVIGVTPLATPQAYDRLRFAFSVPLSSITFAFGDGSPDIDAPVAVFGFSATDAFVGVLSFSDDGSLGGTLSGTFAGASYFIVGSGSLSGNDNSLGWEVVDYSAAAPVPEPAGLAMLATGIGLQALSRRKRRPMSGRSTRREAPHQLDGR